MKSLRYRWLVTGTAVLGLLIASCSSKQEDDGSGGGSGPTGNVGGANVGTGGATAGLPHATGGRQTADTVFAGDTGGVYVPPATGGSKGFDPDVYCNGIFKGRSCGATQVSADVRVVNMLLVVDESGSMNDPPTTGAASKWTIMAQALSAALSDVKQDINFGLLLYPYKAGGITGDAITDTCAVPGEPSAAVNIPIGAGIDTVPQIIQKVQSQTPAGGTPTADALARAYDYYATGDGRALPGTRWVLLATDGGPNCNQGLTCTAETCTQNMDKKCAAGNCCEGSYGYICLDDAATTSAITKLATIGVKTFVVGIPGSEAYANSLNSFAVAGKMPNAGALGEKFYPVSATSALDDLTKAFKSITTQLVTTCDIPLTATPQVGADKINVAIDCKLQTPLPVGMSLDASTASGFYIDYSYAPEPAHLKLVGAPCDGLTATGAHQVDIIAGCQTIN